MALNSILRNPCITFQCEMGATDSTVQGIEYVCNDRIFDSRPFMYSKIFLKKLLEKFVFHTFMLLLAPFASKLVNYSRHRESLKIRKNSEIDDISLR